jgi:thiol-disulfide isomerase/thioredoxin
MNKSFAHLVVLGLILLPVLAQGTNKVIAPHAEDLVALKGNQLVSFKPGKFLNAPYTILYFAAGWCPDCRRFSPALVAAYDHQSAGSKRFEVLLISKDRSQIELVKYMQTEKMNWPALAFDKVEHADDLQKFHTGKGIPWLTVIDPNGEILLQSTSDKDALEVLDRLQQLVKGKS